ncbi:hypothetical protein V5P93_000617 [Actinokineospora auranticolor]|uniref:Uncharacterized protein n=1 Tax=Actinokineospora auranticolor TaxID=155976 RepID=A0A2S6GZ50_9PSEU|nr:hypothetical protein [Actinokineospora auranticolor]PPK70503.1 hypothetical protein CLV40_102418 [Actinokineospora auranticolor]
MDAFAATLAGFADWPEAERDAERAEFRAMITRAARAERDLVEPGAAPLTRLAAHGALDRIANIAD